jgi:TonB family protein
VQSELVRKAQEAAPDAFLGQQTQVADRQTVSSVPMVEATSRSKPRAQDQPREQTPKTQTLTKTRPKVDVKASSLSKLGLAILPEAGAKRELTSEERAPMHVPADAMVESRVAREYVKGFKESDRTILNTKEYIFYGYFQRIRQRLDRAWEKSLRDKLEKIYHRGRSLASERDYTTRTLVTLDQTGKVVRVQILEESGTRDLDDAAVRAFNEAGPFPNPPQGLVGVGKAVEIRWDFVLRT